MDRISALPDHLLHHILSFLPTKLAIKTSLLSSRWRNLWTATPALHFDDDSHNDDDHDDNDDDDDEEPSSRSFLDFARLALLHRDPAAPLRSFRLSTRRHHNDIKASEFAALVGGVAEHYSIHELHLDLSKIWPLLRLPPSILSLASLKVLNLVLLYVRWPPSASLPSLEILTLSQVFFPSDTARDFVSRSCPRLKRCRMHLCCGLLGLEVDCPMLERLYLGDLFGVEWTRIAGESLKTLEIRGSALTGPSGALLISTPSLQEFRWVNQPPHRVSMQWPMPSLSSTSINLMDCPESYRYHSDACAGTAALVLAALGSKRLEIRCLRLLGEGVLKGDIERPAAPTHSGLEYLRLRVDRFDTLNMLGIAFLLQLAPNLKTLEIFLESLCTKDDDLGSQFPGRLGGFGLGGFWESQGLSLQRLSCVRVTGAEGTPYEIDFVEFLLRTVTALKEVTIEVFGCADSWLKIRKTPRASSSVKPFIFSCFVRLEDLVDSVSLIGGDPALLYRRERRKSWS